MAKGFIEWKCNKEKSEYNLSFIGDITASIFFDEADNYWGKMQNEFRIIPSGSTILLDMTEVYWFDMLSLQYLILELIRLSKENKIVFTKLECRDDIEKARFHLFLKDVGMLTIIEEITGSGFWELCDLSQTEKFKSEIFLTTYGLCPTVCPITIVRKDLCLPEVLNNIFAKLKESGRFADYSELNRVMALVEPIIQETIDNVFEHAFDYNDDGYCSIYLRYINYGHLVNKRAKDFNNATSIKEKTDFLFDIVNKSVRSKQIYSTYLENEFAIKNTYMNSDEKTEQKDVLQIFVVDTGKGIAKSFGRSDKGFDRNLVEKILSEGLRSRNKVKNTNVGGLSMIKHLLEGSDNFIAVKGDYSWIRSNTAPFKPDPSYITARAKEELYASQGTAFIFELGLKEDNESVWEKSPYYNFPNKIYSSEFGYVYKNIFEKTYKEKPVNCLDLRYSNDASNVDTSIMGEKIVLLGKNKKKNLIFSILEILDDKKCTILVLGEIPDREWKKYHFILDKMASFGFKKIIVISEQFQCAVYSKKSGANGYYYDINKSRAYADIGPTIAPVHLRLFSYIVWLKWNDSRTIWKSIVEKDNFLPGRVHWEADLEIDGYLDFFQELLEIQGRELVKQQMLRLRAYYRNIRFVPIDRLMEDLCAEVNRQIGITHGRTYDIGVGSVYVTGATLSDKSYDQLIYLFRHASARDNASALLDWHVEKDGVKSNADVEYYRVGKTPFVSPDGDNYFRKLHYQNYQNKYFLSQTELYNLIQSYSGKRDSRTRIGHVNMIDRHDMLHVDMLEAFEGERNWHYSVLKDKVDNNLWDYVLAEMVLSVCSNIDSDVFNTESKAINDLFAEKIKLYVTEKGGKPMGGVLIFSTDYQTKEIAEKIKLLLDKKYGERIIPISPIVKNRPSSSLLTSPMYLESLRTIFAKVLKENGEILPVTIMFTEAISTRKRAEIEHIMYSLGATSVHTLSLVDRTRMPLGNDKNHKMQSYCRLDLPTARNNNACLLCRGRDVIEGVFDGICLKELKRVARKLIADFDISLCAEDRTDYGIHTKGLILSNQITECIESICESYNIEPINISTDLGLVLFSLESTVISLSSEFLFACIYDDSLDIDVKIVLICAQLYHFSKQELTSSVQKECITKLWEFCKEKGKKENDRYLSLGILILCSLIEDNRKIFSDFLHEIYTKRVYAEDINIALYLFFAILYKKIPHKYVIWELEGIIDDPNERPLDMMYGIVLHTQKDYAHSHSNTSCRIFQGVAIPSQKEKQLLLEVQYLQKQYERIPERYFRDRENDIKDVISILKGEENLIHKLEEERLAPSVFNSRIRYLTKNLLDIATRVNEECFVWPTSNYKKFVARLRDVATSVIKEGHSGQAGELSNIRISETSTLGGRFFYYNYDVETEISYLMSDFRHASEYATLDETSGYDKKYDGVVEISFEAAAVVLTFKNICDSSDNIELIRQKKSNKIWRPSHLIFEEINKRLGVSINPSYENGVQDSDGKNLFIAKVQLPYLDL